MALRDLPKVSFAGGEMSPSTYSRVDLAKFAQGASKIDNYFVEAEGGISVRMGSIYARPVKDITKKTRLIEFVYNEEQSYALEFGDQYMRIFVEGGILVYQTPQTISAITQANPAQITSVGHGYTTGDQVLIVDVVGMTELNGGYYTVTVVDADNYTLDGVNSTSYSAYVSGGDVYRIFELTTPYLEAELSELKYRQSNDVIYFAHPNHEPRKLSRLAVDSWSLDVITFEPKQAPVTGLSVTRVGATGSTTHRYRVTAVAEETAEESVYVQVARSNSNDNLNDTNYNQISWTAAAGASEYNVYKEENGLYGYIGTTENNSFNDTNYAPNLDDTSPKLRQPFSGSGNNPSTVGLHEERSWWGNTDNNPLALYSSQTGQFENTNVSSPTKATDAVTIRLTSGQGNEIRHLRSFRSYLFIFTSGAVWTLGPGGDGDAISPQSKELKIQEWLSSSQVPPITIKSQLLMVSGRANTGFEVHQIGQDIQSGAAGDYTGSDLTVLARHLFQGYDIVDWCYIERPYRLILAVRNDGKILCMTYLHEHQIYAWSTWSMGGVVESICSVPEGQEDVAYMVVKRTIDGVEQRYVEYLGSRQFSTIEDAYFVDCGVKYNGVATSTFTGLDHLEGEDVIIIGDGDKYTGTVSGGSVSIANEVTKASIGLPYEGTMTSLPLNASPDTIAKKKNIDSLVVRLSNTRGFYAGPNEDSLEEYASRYLEDWGDPAATINEMIRVPVTGDWERERTITMKSEAGLPQTIQSMIPRSGYGSI